MDAEGDVMDPQLPSNGLDTRDLYLSDVMLSRLWSSRQLVMTTRTKGGADSVQRAGLGACADAFA